MTFLLVLGSANMDLTVAAPRLPRPGETVTGSALQSGPGGKGLNQAVAAARAGGSVRFAGTVGNDPHGRELRDFLETEGISTKALRMSDAATGTAHITVSDEGENAIVVVPGANGSTTSLDGSLRGLVTSASVLVVQLEVPLPVVRAALALAHGAGVTTVLTPAPAVPLPDEVLRTVDVLVPNRIEAAVLTGQDDPAEAARLLSTFGGWCITTLGADGSILARDGELVGHAPARPASAVDTTGAGDTFSGVLAAALAEGLDMVEAVRRGTAAASLAVTRRGAASAMPFREEILAAL